MAIISYTCLTDNPKDIFKLIRLHMAILIYVRTRVCYFKF